MDDADISPEFNAKLESLKAEHRDLDSAIAVMTEQSHMDQVQVQRMKKRKLQLRDIIDQIEDSATPDIIA